MANGVIHRQWIHRVYRIAQHVRDVFNLAGKQLVEGVFGKSGSQKEIAHEGQQVIKDTEMKFPLSIVDRIELQQKQSNTCSTLHQSGLRLQEIWPNTMFSTGP